VHAAVVFYDRLRVIMCLTLFRQADLRGPGGAALRRSRLALRDKSAGGFTAGNFARLFAAEAPPDLAASDACHKWSCEQQEQQSKTFAFFVLYISWLNLVA
jgi:hypothetical protein